MEKIIDIDLIQKIEHLKEFGIGLHGIGSGRAGEKKQLEIAELILSNGLKLGTNYGSINGNVRPIGIVGVDNKQLQSSLSDYAWGSGKQTNVLVAYPCIVENSSGEKLFLGYTSPPPYGYDQNTHRSLMDIVCSSLGYIPKEFICGYYTDSEGKYGNVSPDEHITYDYTANPNFCNGRKISDQLFEEIKHRLAHYQDLSKACAESLDTLDIDKLVPVIKQKLSILKRFKFQTEIDFFKTIYQDVASRIVRATQQLSQANSVLNPENSVESIFEQEL
ncbi:MAG: hypothetical protein IJ629_02410 [Clostridia bacterium]|nr:hypothetical protein [Clostridia bacterium]